MNELLVPASGWEKSPFYKNAVVVLLAILMSAALINLSFFQFLVLMLLLISPYLIIRPYKTFLFFVSLLVIFSSFEYALKAGANVVNIYWRGAGVLGFSLINCLLFFLFGAALFCLIYEKRNENNRFLLIDFSILVFFITSLIYIIISILTNPRGISMEGFRNAVHPVFGLVGIVQFCLAYFVVKILIYRKKQLIELTNFIFLLVFAKAVYGIIRFAFFGGAPRNFSSLQGVNLKMTFFDIFDSAFFMYIFSFCFLNIFLLLRKKKIFYIAIIITLFNILFSFRRSAWIGVILALLYLFQKFGRPKRILFYAVVLILIILPLISLIPARFGSVENSIRDFSFDFSSSHKIKTSRFGELFYALKTISRSPIFGLGATGKYTAPLEYDYPAPPEFVHSTIVHIALKMGLVGLFILFFVVVGVYSLNYKHKKINFKDEELKVIIYSAYSTLIFLLPDIVFRSHLIEFRLVAGLGLFVGLVRVSNKLLIQSHKINSGK